MAGEIMLALATLIREAWMDEVPSKRSLEGWKMIAVDAKREHDALRADLAAVTKERDYLRDLVAALRELCAARLKSADAFDGVDDQAPIRIDHG